jgi:L-glutamine-phosphate cytidylyltransferase
MATRAIILAAGGGTRLGHLTASIPKWLLPVGGLPIAAYQLEALLNAGISEVLVVGGHGYDALRSVASSSPTPSIEFLFNPRYGELNNWYSLLLALRSVGPLPRNEHLLVINSDLWSSVSWLSQVFRSLSKLNGARLAVDLAKSLTAESMKVATTGRDDGIYLSAIGKAGIAHPVGEYVGALAVDHHSAADLLELLSSCEQEGGRSHEWYEHSIARSCSNTAWQIYPVPPGKWIEIDDPSDLQHAQELATN